MEEEDQRKTAAAGSICWQDSSVEKDYRMERVQLTRKTESLPHVKVKH
jgi:hypothetical protein